MSAPYELADPFLGPRIVLVGEPSAVGSHHATRLSQWLGVALIAPRTLDALTTYEVIEEISNPTVARSGFVLHGVPRSVAEAVAICEVTGGPFDLAIELSHAIGEVAGLDQCHLLAWLDGMGVLTHVDATRSSQAVWTDILDALEPVLWGTGERVG